MTASAARAGLVALITAALLVPAVGLTGPRPALAHEGVAFQTADGITLRGWLWGSGSNVVVLSHMFGTDQAIWFDLARKLSAAGYAALTYDFRGVGRSGGRLVIAHVGRDVVAAVKFVRKRNPRRIFLVGASMGGTASLVGAGQQQVNGVIVMASGMQFRGLDVRPHLPKMRIPKLFIVGSRDAPFNDSAKTMYARTPKPKELKVIPTGAHGTYMFATKHRGEIEQAMLGFLRKYSGK